jgi:hypothetical protein
MTRLDELPADQRAVLSLLLRQHKSYGEIAAMLAISEQAVHDRAHSALVMLAPRSARALDSTGRENVGEYMLGQQSPSRRMDTAAYMRQTPAAKAWAQDLREELADLAPGELPEIPASSMSAARPSSRTGGALILGAAVVIVIVAVVLILDSGGKGGSPASAGTNTTTSTTTSGQTSSASTAKPTVDNQLNLTPTEAGSKAVGVVYVLSEGPQRAFYLLAEHLPKTEGFFYGVWLRSASGATLPLGKAPPVASDGRLRTAGGLTASAGSYDEILLTHETSETATHPGPVVLRGKFSLH